MAEPDDPVFVDTSAFFALLYRSDPFSQKAHQTWQRLAAQRAHLLTSNYVVSEACALVQRRLGMAATSSLLQFLIPATEVYFVNEPEHELAIRMLHSNDRRTLSLVDCTSFIVMRAFSMRRAFHFDAHFEEQGFEFA